MNKKFFLKAFFEKFYLSYLRKFDCNIYALNKYLSRKNKLVKNTHLDFLFDYDNINIFFI